MIVKQCYLLWQIFTAILLAHWKKIHILGPPYLRQELVQNKIRAVLICRHSLCRAVETNGRNKMANFIFPQKITAAAKQIYSTIY